MRHRILIALAFLATTAATALASVSLVLTYPTAGENVGGIYQNPGGLGTASSTGGSITNVDIDIDSVFYSTASGTSNWNLTIDARFLTVGSHTIRARATDSVGAVGVSSTTTFTVFHVTPVCNHTLVGGNIYCEASAADVESSGNNSMTYSAGHSSGSVMFAYAFGNFPIQPQGLLPNDITSGQTQIQVNPSYIGLYPTPPFYATISDRCVIDGCSYSSRATEKIHVTTMTPTSGFAQQETGSVLPNSPSYNNGAAGVGATLTATSNGALVINGYSVLVNDRIVVNNQASAFQNGVYKETTLGTGSVPYVLTRSTDYNTPTLINTGPAIPAEVPGGINSLLVPTSTITIIGTDSLSYMTTYYVMTVDQRGVAGKLCVGVYDYPDAEVVIGGGTLLPCGGAASHIASSIFNFWDVNTLPVNTVSNVAGDTWTLIGLGSSGPGDYAVAPVGLWYAKAATTVSTDTINLNAPNDSAFLASDSSIYSGVGALYNWVEKTGVSGPTLLEPYSTSSLFPTLPGNLNAGFSSGAPTGGLQGWQLRSADTSRPFTVSIDSYPVASTTTENALFSSNSEGYYAWGVSFLPASTNTVSAVIYSDLAANLVNNRVWIKNYPQYGLSWDTSGHWPNYLDCTASSNTVSGLASCDWLELSGPSTLSFGNVHGTTTTVTNVSSGTYVIQVTAHDGAGNIGVASQTIGAISCDSNGVLTPGDTNFTQIFGPTICFGRNPYGFQDERHLAAMIIRNGVYNSTRTVYSTYTFADPDFVHNQAGTISYTFNGTGNAIGTVGTTLTTGISASSSTIIVASTAAALIDLSSFPTRVFVWTGGYNGPYEEVRICSNTGLTLNVCYDGRGISGSVAGQSSILPAQSWPVGSVVGQYLFKGSGTNFLTVFSTAGAGGPAGPLKYNVGTATMTANSATMTGIGTAWSTNVSVGDAVRIAGTHSSSTFTFVAYVSAVNSDTSLTLSRVYPATADTATGLTYAIVPSFERYLVYRWPRPSPFTGTGQVATFPTGCEDDTHCFSLASITGGRDIPSLDGSTFTAQNYAFSDVNLYAGYANQSSLGGINFYGENLAWMSLYERSGLSLAKTMADETSANWLMHPNWAGGISVSGSILFPGGGFIGSTAHYLVFGTPAVSELRPWWYGGMGVAAASCDAYDTRDSGYLSAWGILGALYDPDTSSSAAPGGIPWQTYFRNQFGPGAGTLYARDVSCKRSNGGVDTNSWATGFLWNQNTPVTMTNGSPNVTGSGFTSALCQGVDSGTVTMIASSDAVTATNGTFATNAGSIMINGRYYQFLRKDATHGWISVLWPGSSGSFSYMDAQPLLTNDSAPSVASYGQSSTDPAIKNNYLCIYNNSGSLTLDRNFVGTSGANWQFLDNLSGYGQQIFMLGIKNTGMKYAGALDSTLGTGYTTLSAQAAQWVHDYGIQNENTTINYGRIYGNCESGGTILGATQTMQWKTPGCSVQWNSSLIVEEEQLLQEAFSSAGVWYTNNATPTNKAYTDGLYCSIWCKTGWNAPGVTDNPASVGNNIGASNLTDVQLANGKYPGQLFGMGFAADWPALEFVTPSQGGTSGVTFGGSATFGGHATFGSQ